MYRRFLLLALCLVALAACTARGAIGLAPKMVDQARIKRIFVATTRQMDTNILYNFNDLRTSKLTYARFDMSIPPTHKIGKIEWPRTRLKPNPATDFAVEDAEIFKTPSEFGSKLHTALKTQRNKDEVVVFVHGYNSNFAESLYRFAQITTDMDIRGAPVLYAWPAAASTLEYIHDRDSVLFARDGLQALLDQLAKVGTKRIILVAHSVGSNLVMETLRQMTLSGDKRTSRLIKGVVLISPDIDQNVFEMQIRSLKPIPKPFVVFSDKKDHALRFMSFLTGRRVRVGQIVNAQTLAKYNIDVVDTSVYKDGGGYLNHSVALTSPTIIAILRKLSVAAELSRKNGGNPRTLLQKMFNLTPKVTP
ncbi:MAG: alpha/beta hydrolase [Rhodobacterales bacterium]